MPPCLLIRSSPSHSTLDPSTPTLPHPHPSQTPLGASEGNAAHLTAVTRKIGESHPIVLDEEGTEEFLKHGLTSSEGQACAAIHGLVWPKGGDRAVFRNIYAMSRDPNGGPATTLTVRVPEALSPEVGQRSELPETRSFHDSLNEALDRKSVV